MTPESKAARAALEAVVEKWNRVGTLYRDSSELAARRGNIEAKTRHAIISHTYLRHAEQLQIILDAWEQE